jgi:two-component system, cell cycle sensor histidine kinase and response regulator CckA
MPAFRIKRAPTVWVLVLCLVVSATLIYSLVTGSRLARSHAPLQDAAMEIKYEAAIAHLWFEEAISGDQTRGLAEVLGHIDESDWYAEVMLEGGENSEGVFVPLDDPALRREIEVVREGIARFRAIAEQRWDARQQSGIGSPIDQEFDEVFDEVFERFVEQAHRVETALKSAMADSLLRFRLVQGALILTCLVLSALVGVVFYRYERRRVLDTNRILESEARYRAIAEDSPVLICRFRSGGEITYVNETCGDHFGKSPEELVDTSFLSLIPEENRQGVMDDIRALTFEAPLLSHEHPVLAPGGEARWQRWTNRALFDADGEITGYHAIGEDITDRRRAEAALKASETRFRMLFEKAPLGYQSLDEEGNFLEVNEKWCKVLGYTREEVLGRNFGEFLPPDFRPHFKENFAKFKSMGYILGVEFEMVRKDGAVIVVWFDGQIGNTPEGAFRQTHCVLDDVTERKREEEERDHLHRDVGERLKELRCIYAVTESIRRRETLEEVFEDVMELIPAGWQYPPITRVRACLGAREFTSEDFKESRWSQSEDLVVAGAPCGRLEVFYLEERPESDEGPFLVEERNLLEGIASALGEAMGLRAAQEGQEKVEEQLRQAQKMEAVGQLAGGIAHDFNNLLQAILGYGEMALENTQPEESAHRNVEEIVKAGGRARTLVNQLLAFSRRQVLEMREVDLNEVIAELMKMLRRLIGEHLSLEVISGHELGTVLADSGQIGQILTNLCVNARDAMPEGGTITIETENVLIDDAYVTTHAWVEPGRYVLMSVTDSGCGMSEEVRESVFEPFFTTKGVGQGTGLGLATVYGLVKQHQGMVHIYSELDRGTTFKVYLPLVERSAGAVGDKIEGPVEGGTETILLAEDDEMVRELTRAFLEQAGYTVFAVGDGEQALRIFEERGGEIDLALLDVVMPKLGGRAVFDRIRKLRPRVRVLFCSGYSMNAIHTNFILDDGLALIRKPYQRDELLRKLREVLGSTAEARR